MTNLERLIKESPIMTRADIEAMLTSLAGIMLEMRENNRQIREAAEHVGTIAARLQEMGTRTDVAIPAGVTPRHGNGDGRDSYLRAREAMAYLNIGSSNSLYRLIREHRMPFSRIGRLYRFERAELDAWARGHDSALERAERRAARKKRTK
jgi:excisionase family DNA binding protein